VYVNAYTSVYLLTVHSSVAGESARGREGGREERERKSGLM